MIEEFRSDIISHLSSEVSTPVRDDIPESVAEVPCIVVGRASVSEGTSAAVLDLQADVWVVGRRSDAGGRDIELDQIADDVWEAFGTARAVTLLHGTYHAIDCTGRAADIAGKTHPAYTITVTTSVTSY